MINKLLDWFLYVVLASCIMAASIYLVKTVQAPSCEQSNDVGALQSLKYDAVKTCQTLASQTSNAAWKYQDCIDQFKAVIDTGKVMAL